MVIVLGTYYCFRYILCKILTANTNLPMGHVYLKLLQQSLIHCDEPFTRQSNLIRSPEYTLLGNLMKVMILKYQVN